MSLCGGGGGGVDGSSGSSGVGDTDRSIVYKCGEGGLYGSGWFFILGEIFLVEVVEEVELAGRGGGGWGCCEASSVVCEWEGRFFLSF